MATTISLYITCSIYKRTRNNTTESWKQNNTYLRHSRTLERDTQNTSKERSMNIPFNLRGESSRIQAQRNKTRLTVENVSPEKELLRNPLTVEKRGQIRIHFIPPPCWPPIYDDSWSHQDALLRIPQTRHVELERQGIGHSSDRANTESSLAFRLFLSFCVLII